MSKKIEALTMPKWGIEMEEGKLTEWLIDEGSSFSKGDPLLVVETDKISNEIEAEFDGLCRKKLVDVDGTYPVGALLAVFASEEITDEEVDQFINDFVPVDSSFQPESAVSEKKPEPTPTASDEKPKSSGDLPSAPPDNVNISPKAWEVALELDVDVSTITPSGRRGRISVQDVEQAADPAKLAAYKGEEEGDTGSVSSSDNPSELIPHSGMRKVIAERTTASKNTAPHFYLNVDLDAKKLSAEREKMNKGKDKKEKISINDLLIKCVATALTRHPEVNINWSDEGILQFQNADISIAVATDAGLITPIVKKANEKTVEEISSDAKRLSDLAHNNKLMPEDYQGGTFSISNLGMLGIKSFTAVINPPQCGILAVGKLEDDKISVTMSCDHRGIDGAVGARFLQTLSTIVAEVDI
ncbi:MAG: dihydrolipoamide acetyltransferase family protein [Pseudomonadota bacterium]|jgi:pyruvate dehydrogenase E2 component (dihydrolipoamide acetyltransferase)|nr:dihydrolipoamide acetyltransferase family protein [Pseudomonadota bacterium]MEC9414548.1 dihydrolipoamide acetyltransferase family protein [Pseudomonadota bacterium]|tara:strand:- start:123 stop:1364 length:1242 start_codon:yes stop_codon:yes gene_type:complete